MSYPTQKQAKANSFKSDSLIEQLRDVGQGVTKSVTKDLVSGIGTDALSALFSTPKSGDIKQGQKVRLNQKPEESGSNAESRHPDQQEYANEKYERERQEQFNPYLNQENLSLLRRHEEEVAKKIEEIRQELKSLIASLKIVDRQISQTIDEPFVDPGIYHLNFLDRLKTILKLMRKNLSDSSSWLSVMRSRKKERRYWAQYKKKGTTFGLSNERNVATQIG